MPDWDIIRKRYQSGELSPVQRDAVNRAFTLGEVPLPGEDSPAVRRRQLDKRIFGSNPDSMSEQEKLTLMGSWLEDSGYDPTGVGYFTDDPAGVSGDAMMRMRQNEKDPKRHEDVMSNSDKWIQKSREQKVEDVPTFTRENILATMENFAAFGFEGFMAGGDATKQAKTANRVKAEGSRLMKEDFMAMRSMYESVITSPEGRSLARSIAETGVWDQNAVDALPDEEQRLLPGYVQTIKPLNTDGVLTEAGVRLGGGVKDIVVGGIDYIGKKGTQAYYAARDLSGDRSAKGMLDALDEVIQDQSAESDALAEKFVDRQFHEKIVTGIAESLPLMASFYINTPAALLSKASNVGRFAKVANSVRKLTKHMPVGLATMSMAKSHEDMMVARGVDRATAGIVAPPTAIVNMAIEKMALDNLLSIGKGKLYNISNNYIVGRFIKGTLAGAATETTEELLQGLFEEIATQAALNDVDTAKLSETLISTFIDSLPTTLGFGAIGGAGAAASGRVNISETEAAFTRDSVFRERLNSLIIEGKPSEAEKADSFNTIFNEWNSAKTLEAKEEVFEKFSVRNTEEAQKIFEDEARDRELFIQEEREQLELDAISAEKFQTETLPKLQDEARAFATQAGIDSVEFVDRITDAMDANTVGRISGNTVEVLNTFSKPKEIVRHEVFHKFLEDVDLLSSSERKVLDSATDKMLAALKNAGLNIGIYDAYEDGQKSEEVLADAGSILNEQELTVWQKILDLYEKVKNFVRGDGFNSFRSVLKDLESRGMASSATTAKGGTQVKFAERISSSEQSFRELTQAMSAKMLKGDKVDETTVKNLMTDGSMFTAQSVVNEAAAIAGELGIEGDAIDTANAAATRLNIKRIADKRYLERITKRVQREGVRAGFKAKESEVKAQKMRNKAKSRSDKKERQAAQAANIDDTDIHRLLLEENSDIDSVIDSIVKVVETTLGDSASDNLFNATLQKTVYTVLSRANVGLSSAAKRASVAKKLEKLRAKESASKDFTLNAAKSIALQINEGVAKQEASTLRASIRKAIKNAIKPISKRKELKRQAGSPDVNAWLMAVKQSTEMSRSQKQSSIANLAKGVNEPLDGQSKEAVKFRNSILSELPSLDHFSDMDNETLGLLALNVVDSFGNLDDMSVASLQDALAALNETIDAGKAIRAKQLKEKREENKKKAVEIADGIVSEKTIRLSDKQSSLTSMVSSLTGLRSMFKLISSSGSGAENKRAKDRLAGVLRNYNRADQSFRLEEFQSHEIFVNKISEIYDVAKPGLATLKPGAKDAFSVITSLKEKKDDYKKYSNDKATALSKFDLMQKYGAMVQADGSKAAAELNSKGITAEGILSELDQSDRMLLDFYRQYYKEQLPFINKVMKRIAGVTAKMTDPLYLPIYRMADSATGIREVHNAMSLFPQYMVDRVDSERAFSEDYDIHDVWLMRMTETSKFKHFSDINVEIRDVLMHDKTLDAISRSWGEKMSNAWRDKLSLQMIGYVSNDTTAAKGFQQSLNTVRKLWVGSKFFLNMRVGFKQLSSIPAFAFEVGMRNTGQYIKTAFTEDGRKAMLEIVNHPLAKERSKLGNSEALRSFLTNTAPSKLKRVLQFGRLPNTVGDLIPVVLVGQGIYRSKLNELYETGMSEDLAKEEAISFLFEIVESTQQSGRSKDLADLQLSNGVWGKILFTFKSTVRQYLEKEIVDFVAAIRAEDGMKDKALRDFGRTMAINHLMLPGLYNGMNMAFNYMLGDSPDEDDMYMALMSMAMGPFSAIPIYGMMMAGFLDSLATGAHGAYGDAITPFAGAIGDIRAVSATINGLAPWTDAKVSEGIDKILTSNFAPYREIKKAVRDDNAGVTSPGGRVIEDLLD